MTSMADGAILGADIRTLDPAAPSASAVAWRDGRIVAVGDETEVRLAIDASTETIDGSGITLTPGLTDAHIHPFFVRETRGADLTACRSRRDLVEALARHRREHPEERWLLGWGLEYGVFTGERIEGGVIEEAAGEVPALLTFMDQHTALASPAAVRLAGLTGEERFAEEAEVVAAGGRPTGELRENAAMDLVRDLVPELSGEECRRRAVGFLEALNRAGVTGAHAMNGDPDTLDFLRELEGAGELTVRLVVPFTQVPETGFEEMEAQLGLAGERGRLWRAGVAKFFIDGVIDSGTAWLHEPDADGAGLAPFWPDPERYRQAVRLFSGAGFQCATHAVGDRGVSEALAAYAEASPAAAPHRVEHIETLGPDDLEAFASSGTAASMQPLHMQWRRPDHSDSWASRLGRERAARGFPTRELLDRGVTLALGSDWPVAQCDPRIGMAWARLRRPAGEPDFPPFEPEQRLSGAEALAGYTSGPAAVVGESGLNGRIAVGMRADLTGFGADPVTLPADELPELPVRLTVVDGRCVHRDG